MFFQNLIARLTWPRVIALAALMAAVIVLAKVDYDLAFRTTTHRSSVPVVVYTAPTVFPVWPEPELEEEDSSVEPPPLPDSLAYGDDDMGILNQ